MSQPAASKPLLPPDRAAELVGDLVTTIYEEGSRAALDAAATALGYEYGYPPSVARTIAMLEAETTPRWQQVLYRSPLLISSKRQIVFRDVELK